MSRELLLAVAAVLSLVPAALVGWRAPAGGNGRFWMTLGVALAGAVAVVSVHLAGSWKGDLSSTLWVTIAATLVLYAGLAGFFALLRRLLALLAPYLLVLGSLATVWIGEPGRPLALEAAPGWVWVHIAVSVATYALVTLGGIAALAAFLRERALKRKRPTRLTGLLPSVADCEAWVVRLLAAGEAVLALGLLSGVVTLHAERGHWLQLDHKTLLSGAAFLVIGGLLLAHRLTGVRGRAAARLVLVAWLLLTLGYPGVKFVTDVLLT